MIGVEDQGGPRNLPRLPCIRLSSRYCHPAVTRSCAHRKRSPSLGHQEPARRPEDPHHPGAVEGGRGGKKPAFHGCSGAGMSPYAAPARPVSGRGQPSLRVLVIQLWTLGEAARLVVTGALHATSCAPCLGFSVSCGPLSFRPRPTQAHRPPGVLTCTDSSMAFCLSSALCS